MKSIKIMEKNEEEPVKLEEWDIRMDSEQFERWLKEKKSFKLFFDGASKGNPGKAGGGGVIIDPDGKIEIDFSWNIGIDSNNMAEVYGLWQGLKQLQGKGVEEVLVFGDSRVIIQALNGGRRDKNGRIARMINRIRSKAKIFKKIKFYHILRGLNVLADQAANTSIAAGLHDLIVNSVSSIDIPP